MARSTNPYRPGFNAAPPAFVGRERLLGAVREALAVAALDGRTPRPIIITGTRGVGKTVALGEAASLAAVEHAWPTVHVEVRPGRDFTPLLTERLNAARHVLEHTTVDDRRHPVITGGKLGASALGVGAEVEVHLERHGSGPVDPLEAALGAALRVAIGGGRRPRHHDRRGPVRRTGRARRLHRDPSGAHGRELAPRRHRRGTALHPRAPARRHLSGARRVARARPAQPGRG